MCSVCVQSIGKHLPVSVLPRLASKGQFMTTRCKQCKQSDAQSSYVLIINCLLLCCRTIKSIALEFVAYVCSFSLPKNAFGERSSTGNMLRRQQHCSHHWALVRHSSCSQLACSLFCGSFLLVSAVLFVQCHTA